MSSNPNPHPTAPAPFLYNPPSAEIAILHCDAELMIIDKPCGLLSVPGKGDDRLDCLITRLQKHYPQARIVHRLDLDTSGVMVIAMNPAAHRHLGLQFERRHVEKTYIALVDGNVAADSGRVDLPIRVDWPNRPRQMIDHAEGRSAVTDWQVLAREDDRSRIALRPLTGRSHQLRLHMRELGHPILGDTLYAPEAARKAMPRLCLHALNLSLYHPDGGERLTFEVACPF